MARTFNVFLSHSWSYSNAHTRLTELLDKRPYFFFRDYSIPKHSPVHNAPNAQALYDAISRKIAPCHIVLIMAGVYATYSSWIKKEIAIAKRRRKPIIAIRPWANARISTIVANNADSIVGWNSESVVTAIRRHAL